MDTTILNYLNSFAGRWMFFDTAVIFKAEYLGWWMLTGLGAFLIYPVYFWRKRFVSTWTFHVQVQMQMVFVALVSAFFSRFFITDLIRFFYSRPRPFETMDIYQLVAHDGGSSFPSGHAAFFFALAVTIFFYNRRWGIWYFIWAMVIGFARIFAGVHWPADIIGGIIVGVFCGVLVHRLLREDSKKVWNLARDARY